MNIYLNNIINPNEMLKVQVNSEIFQKQQLVGSAKEILEVIMTANYAIHNAKKYSQLKLQFVLNIVYVIYASG